MFQSTTRLLSCLFLFCAFGVVSSFGQSLKQKMEVEKIVEINPAELRAYMDEFFVRFSSVVEESADSIRTITKNKDVAAKALFWKMNAIPAAQRTIFTTNPLEAMIDAEVLCIQMDHFFKDGNGKAIFLAEQPVALRATKKLRTEIRALSTHFIDEANAKYLEKIQFFALNNPINSLYFNRKSTRPILAEVAPSSKVRLKSMAEDMNQGIKDLNNRINNYTDVLPKQIRWQSEYMLYEAIPENLRAIALDTLSFGLDSMTKFVSTIPGLANEQRVALTKDLQNERQLILTLAKEERALMVNVLQSERALVLSQIFELREKTIEDIERMRSASLSQIDATSKSLVEYIFVRAIILLLLAAFCTSLLLWFFTSRKKI